MIKQKLLKMAPAALVASLLLGGLAPSTATEGNEWTREEVWQLLKDWEALPTPSLSAAYEAWTSLAVAELQTFLDTVLAMPDHEFEEYAARFDEQMTRIFDALAPQSVDAQAPLDTSADRATSGMAVPPVPKVRLGIDRPNWDRTDFTFWRDGTNKPPGALCIADFCLSEWFFNYEVASFSEHPGSANTYAFAASLSAGLFPIGSVLHALRTDVSEKSPDDQHAWAAMGMQYDLVKGCHEQGAVVPAEMQMIYDVRGDLYAKSGLSSVSYADIAIRMMAYTSSTDPIGQAQFAPTVYSNYVYSGPLKETSQDIGFSAVYKTPVNQHVGRGTTYGIMSGNAFALPGTLGAARGISDFYGDGWLWLKDIDLDWVDNTAPATSASLSGTAGREGWYRSPVVVTLTAQDPQTCVLGIEHELTLGGMRWVDVDEWDPKTTFTIGGDGLHERQFRAKNYDREFEPMKTVEVKIDKTDPVGEITRPRQGHCYAQNVEAPTLGIATCATGTSLRLEADAVDPETGGVASGVYEVSFYWGDELVGSTGTAPYSVDWDIFLRSGQRPLSVCVEDVAGNIDCQDGPNLQLA